MSAKALYKNINEHKDKLSKPHFLFSAEAPKFPEKNTVGLNHDDIVNHLKGAGYDAVGVEGHYGAPEKSILVYGVNKDQAHQLHGLAARLGQDSSIYSDGKNHEMKFHHGEHAGKTIKGYGTTFHPEKPVDYFTTLPGGTHHFTHHFNFENSHLGKSEDLQKGQSGDWHSEGYSIKHKMEGNKIHVSAHDKDGNRVGGVSFIDKGDHIKNAPASFVSVDKGHQRKGIASAMYLHAEKVTGKKAQKSHNTTGAGAKLWDSPNRAFGKSEDLQKAPLVDQEYSQVHWPHHPNELGKYKKTIVTGGQRVHVHETDDGHIFSITENGHHSGKPISRVEVRSMNPDTHDDTPYVSTAHTEEQHRGEGLSTLLHNVALKHYGNLKSDTLLSPSSNKLWGKLKGKVSLATTDDRKTQHEATWVGKSEDSSRIELTHYSAHPDLKEVDPAFKGTGVDSRTRGRDTEHPHSFFYGPEGEHEDVVKQRLPHKYTTSIDTKEHPIYDIGTDPQGFHKQVLQENNQAFNMDMMHSKIKEAGFSGFKNSAHPTLPHVYVMYKPLKVKKVQNG